MRIEAIETLIPEARLDVEDILKAAKASSEEIHAFTSLFRMHTVAAAALSISTMGYFELLMERISPSPSLPGPKALFHAHSLPMHPGKTLTNAGELSKKFGSLAGLQDVFEVDQFNCASLFYAMAAADRMLSTGLIGEAVVFGGDCLSDWTLKDRYIPGSTVLGDGYVLLRLSAREGGLQIGPISTRLHAGFASGLDGSADEMARFNRAHMDIINAALADADHNSRQGEIFPHNINGLCWRLYSRTSRQPAETIHDNLVGEIGHCCNADPFLSLDQVARKRPVHGTVISVGMAGFTGSAHVSGSIAPVSMAA